LPTVLSQLHRNEVATFEALDPLDTLELRVNDQRVTRAFSNNGSVLQRDAIGGKTLVAPLGMVSRIRQDPKRIDAFGERNSFFSNIAQPDVLP
jgi:hypothetical protein